MTDIPDFLKRTKDNKVPDVPAPVTKNETAPVRKDRSSEPASSGRASTTGNGKGTGRR